CCFAWLSLACWMRHPAATITNTANAAAEVARRKLPIVTTLRGKRHADIDLLRIRTGSEGEHRIGDFAVDNGALVDKAHARFGVGKIGVDLVGEHHATDITIVGVANLEIHRSR